MSTQDDPAFEARLETELRRHIVAPDAPVSLFQHVERLGTGSEPLERERVRVLPTRTWLRGGRRGAFAALGTVGVAVVLVAGALMWRGQLGQPGHTSIARPPISPTAAPKSPASNATARPQPSDAATWTGGAIGIGNVGTLGSDFVWAVTATDGSARERLIVSEDGGRTSRTSVLPVDPIVDPPPPHGGLFSRGIPNRTPHVIVFGDPDHAFLANVAKLPSGSNQVDVYRSSDGGRSWTRSAVDAAPDASEASLFVLDGSHGWLTTSGPSGVRLFGTTDGGATWTRLASGSKAAVPNAVGFTTASDGWGIGRFTGSFFRTHDGGRTWNRTALPVPGGYNTISLQAPLPLVTNGTLVVYGDVSLQTPRLIDAGNAATWESTDGGVSWRVASVNTARDITSTENVPEIGFMTDPRGHSIVADTSGRPVFMLADVSGVPHQFAVTSLLDNAAPYLVTTAAASGPRSAWAVVQGSCASDGNHSCPALFTTSDGGATWTAPLGDGRLPRDPVPPCCGVMYPAGSPYQTGTKLTSWLDSTHGWAIVGTTLRWTDDGGSTWSPAGTVPAAGAIQFIDREHGWLAASMSADPVAARFPESNPVYRTADGGRTWTPATLPALDYWEGWSWLHFSDVSHGVVARCELLIAGQSLVSCRMFETTDGGASFHEIDKQQLPTPLRWATPTFGYGIAYDAGRSTFIATHDGGRTWTRAVLPDPAGWERTGDELVVGSFDATGSGKLLAVANRITNDTLVGSQLVRFETTDGGTTWRLAAMLPVSPLHLGGQLVDGRIVELDQGKPALLLSDDFGATSTTVPLPATGATDVAFGDRLTGTLVVATEFGASPSALYVTRDGGKTWTRVP